MSLSHSHAHVNTCYAHAHARMHSTVRVCRGGLSAELGQSGVTSDGLFDGWEMQTRARGGPCCCCCCCRLRIKSPRLQVLVLGAAQGPRPCQVDVLFLDGGRLAP